MHIGAIAPQQTSKYKNNAAGLSASARLGLHTKTTLTLHVAARLSPSSKASGCRMHAGVLQAFRGVCPLFAGAGEGDLATLRAYTHGRPKQSSLSHVDAKQ